MTLREAVYALRTIIKENNVDSIIEDEFLINRLNTYRGMSIINKYERNYFLDRNWIQDLGIVTAEVINSADDPLIQRTSVVLSKIEIPQTIELKGLNTLSIRSGTRQQKVNEISMDRLFNMIYLKDEMLNNLRGYFRIGQAIYLYPILKYISVSGILQNPLEGYTTKELTDNNDLTVSAEGTKRNLTIDDEYPIDFLSLIESMIQILKIDYNIIIQSKSDLFPDGLPGKELT